MSEPDRGQGDAINKGFNLSNGTLLTWLNADDTLSNDAVWRVVESWRGNASAGWYIGDLQIRKGADQWIVKPPRVVTRQSFTRGNVVSQPGTFFTREALDKVGAIDTTFNLAMDFELWLRFVDAGMKPVYIASVLATFEIHPDSKTGSASGLRFAEEEARALNLHGRPHEAALAIDRWYWDSTLNELVHLLEMGEYEEASLLAASARSHLEPLLGRGRLFTMAVRISPAIARRLARLKRNRPTADR